MDFNAGIKRAHLRSAIFSLLIAILNIGLGIFCAYLSFNSFKKWKES